jgi:hypothetical protein
MTAGETLMSLKKDVNAAFIAYHDRSMRHSGWFVLAWALALAAVFFGLLCVMQGIGGFAPTPTMSRVEGLIHIAAGVVVFGLSYLLFRTPSIVNSRDKELSRLSAAETAAHNTYHQALWTEIDSYGIDTATIMNHTEHMEANYEFTALRNGEPIDVTVRDFNNEIVFMLNGERMQKPVAV